MKVIKLIVIILGIFAPFFIGCKGEKISYYYDNTPPDNSKMQFTVYGWYNDRIVWAQYYHIPIDSLCITKERATQECQDFIGKLKECDK